MDDLRFDGVALRQGGFELLADCALHADRVTALIGASGSGKSTLLAAVAGFLAPAKGRIRLGDNDLTALPPAARPVSILFQDQNLFPHLSVARNVGLGLVPALRLTAEQRDARDAALKRVGLAGMGERRPHELSGGQQSRAALARALVSGRSWLLLDEAFSALGPALRHEMLDLVVETAADRGISVVMVTHDPDDARRASQETALIVEGRLHAPRPTADLFADPPEALRAYLG